MKCNNEISVIANDLIIYLKVSYKLIKVISFMNFLDFILVFIIDATIDIVIDKLDKIFRFKSFKEDLLKIFNISYTITNIK